MYTAGLPHEIRRENKQTAPTELIISLNNKYFRDLAS